MRFFKQVSFLLILLLLAKVPEAYGQIITNDEDSEQTITPPADNKANRNAKDNEDKIWKWDNVFIGGIPGFGIDNNYLVATMAVEGGYFIHPHIALGGRFSYQYYYYRPYDERYHIFGGGPFIRGYIWKGIFAQMEYEVTSVGPLRIEDSFGNLIGYARFDVNALLLGGGYHGNFDDGFGYYISALFNVINTQTYVYANPQVRLGLTYNFIR